MPPVRAEGISVSGVPGGRRGRSPGRDVRAPPPWDGGNPPVPSAGPVPLSDRQGRTPVSARRPLTGASARCSRSLPGLPARAPVPDGGGATAVREEALLRGIFGSAGPGTPQLWDRESPGSPWRGRKPPAPPGGRRRNTGHGPGCPGGAGRRCGQGLPQAAPAARVGESAGGDHGKRRGESGHRFASSFRSCARNSSGRGQLSSTGSPLRGWTKRSPTAWRHWPWSPGTGFFAP